VPIFSDIKELKGDDVGTVDILTGGFPCQPFSCAGEQRGKEDDRYLWPEMFRIIRETKPTWIIGENVAGIINLGLEDCFLDLGSERYEVQPLIIPAYAVNAPHKRDRVWILAHSKSGRGNNSVQEKRRLSRADTGAIWGDGDYWTDKSEPLGVAYGISDRVDRLKALGNAIVPQVAHQIFKAIVEVEYERIPNQRINCPGAG
jgi:DNA (cytosine-5)-methyltransferase 1